jgi:hypothetical protein
MSPSIPPADQQLARRILDAFEREFWAGHHDRIRLLLAPLRVLEDGMASQPEPTRLLRGVLELLEITAGL